MNELNFGKRLRELREKSGQTQKQLAEYLQVTPQAYSQYERDQRRPDYEQLIRLAKLYRVSLDYLVEGKEPQHYPGMPEGCEDFPPEAQEELLSYIDFLHHKYPNGKQE